MVGYGGKDLQKRKVLSLEWKSEGVMDDESGDSDDSVSWTVHLLSPIAANNYCRTKGQNT